MYAVDNVDFISLDFWLICFSGYVKLRPELFSKYIPNVLPPTCVANIDQYVEETKKMQEEIHSLPGFEQYVTLTVKILKIQTPKICCNHSKIWTM